MSKFFVVQVTGTKESPNYGVARSSKGETEFETLEAAEAGAKDIAGFANGTLFVCEMLSEKKTNRPDE